MSSWPLEPQLATTVMMPCTTSGLTLCSMSGSAIVMPKEIGRNLALAEAELVDLLEHELGVGDPRRQEEEAGPAAPA